MNPTVSDRMTSRPDPGSITRLHTQPGTAWRRGGSGRRCVQTLGTSGEVAVLHQSPV